MGLKSKVRVFYIIFFIFGAICMIVSIVANYINIFFLFSLLASAMLLGGGLYDNCIKKEAKEYIVKYYNDINRAKKYMNNYVKFLRFKIWIGQLFLIASIISFKDYPNTVEEYFRNIFTFKNAIGIFAVIIGNVLFYFADKIFLNIPQKSFMGGVNVFKISSIVVTIIGFLFIIII